MIRHIDDSVKSWQRPGLRRWLVFALLGVLIALSYALLLTGEEAQAKEGKQSPNGESAGGAIEGAAKPVREAAGEVNKLAGNEEAGGKDASSVAAREPAPQADKPAPVDDGTVRDASRSTTTEQVADKAPSAVDMVPETNPTLEERREPLGKVAGTAGEEIRPAVEPALDEVTSVARPTLEGETKPPRAEPILDEATTRLPKAEPILEETAKPEIAPVLNRAASETGPVLERATTPVGPVLEETTSTVKPILDTASSKTEPVLERATTPVGPVLEETAKPEIAPVLNRAASETGPVLESAAPPINPVLEETTSTTEPVLEEANTPAAPIFEEANPPVEPALAEMLPAVEPALDGAIPAAVEPVGEAVGPAARPLGEEAIPTAGPVLEKAAFPDVEPAIGAADPVSEPVSETVAPVVESGFGEGVVLRSAGPPVLEGNAGAIPASLSALPSHALAVEARGVLPDAHPTPATLGSAWDYGPVRDESPVSAVGSPEARSKLFDGSFAVDGSRVVLLSAITAEDVREGTPHPLPFESPPATPPSGISSGSSGASMVLGLLAILASLPVLSRAGGLSRSAREAFKLDFSPQLVVERPG